MRFLYLGLFALTFLSVLWTVLQWAFPLGQVDAFYAAHKLEIYKAVGDENAEELMGSISATIVRQVRGTVLATGGPLLITTFGWLAMFVIYARPEDRQQAAK